MSGLSRGRGNNTGPTPTKGRDREGTRTPSPTGVNPTLIGGPEGPITPRNNAGPWVFDGSGGRTRGGDVAMGGVGPSNAAVAMQTPLISLDAAANGEGGDLNGA